MDQQQAERVNKLAASLKELHLAGSTEEAYARAKEIILGTSGDEKTIGQLFKESGIPTDDLKRDLDELKTAETNERLDANELSTDIKKVEQELKQQEKRLDDAHHILDKARAILKRARDGKLTTEHEYWQKRDEPPAAEPAIEEYDLEPADEKESEEE